MPFAYLLPFWKGKTEPHFSYRKPSRNSHNLRDNLRTALFPNKKPKEKDNQFVLHKLVALMGAIGFEPTTSTV